MDLLRDGLGVFFMTYWRVGYLHHLCGLRPGHVGALALGFRRLHRGDGHPDQGLAPPRAAARDALQQRHLLCRAFCAACRVFHELFTG